MSMYTDLIDNLEVLNLQNIKNTLPGYLDEMKDKNISFTEMLYDLTKEEIKYQTERAAKVNIKVSAFPFEKTINDFDFSYQPSVDKNELYDLETRRFSIYWNKWSRQNTFSSRNWNGCSKAKNKYILHNF